MWHSDTRPVGENFPAKIIEQAFKKNSRLQKIGHHEQFPKGQMLTLLRDIALRLKGRAHVWANVNIAPQ